MQAYANGGTPLPPLFPFALSSARYSTIVPVQSRSMRQLRGCVQATRRAVQAQSRYGAETASRAPLRKAVKASDKDHREGAPSRGWQRKGSSASAATTLGKTGPRHRADVMWCDKEAEEPNKIKWKHVVTSILKSDPERCMEVEKMQELFLKTVLKSDAVDFQDDAFIREKLMRKIKNKRFVIEDGVIRFAPDFDPSTS